MTLPLYEFSNRKWRVPAVRVSTLGIKSTSAEPKNAVCFVSRGVS